MSAIAFEGDPTDHDGYVMTATSTIIENGKRAALLGDLVYCPRAGHGVNPIVEGDTTMMSDGRPLVKICPLTPPPEAYSDVGPLPSFPP